MRFARYALAGSCELFDSIIEARERRIIELNLITAFLHTNAELRFLYRISQPIPFVPDIKQKSESIGNLPGPSRFVMTAATADNR